MNPKETKLTSSELPLISPKTSSEQLKTWVREHWPSDGRKRVAEDIVRNAKELVKSNTDWELVLGSIRNQHLTSLQFGSDAIAVNDARFIGGLGAVTEWPMHHQAIVYLSGMLLAERVKSGGEFEDFKERMRQAAVDYGQKALFPHANSYMQTLDFLLGVENRRRHRNTINKIEALLRDGSVEEAYRIMGSRDDLVRRRGQNSSRNITSSIRTPPKFGI